MTVHRLPALLLALLLLGGCAAADAPAPPSQAAISLPPPTATATPTFAAAMAADYGAPPAIAIPPDPAVSAAPAPTAAPTSRPAPAKPAVFGMDLYRRGVYVMQATWYWCAAASIEMARNMILGQADHSTAGQQRYFDYMRAHDVYPMPEREGVDLVGLLAGLRHFVDARYDLVAARTFDSAVRAAVISIRRTHRPAALVVMNGHHVWLMTGFTATADPARSSSFRVLSVRVVGPLYGRQSSGGYDMAPDTRLTYAAFARFLHPYHFKFGPTPWDGRYVVYGA